MTLAKVIDEFNYVHPPEKNKNSNQTGIYTQVPANTSVSAKRIADKAKGSERGSFSLNCLTATSPLILTNPA